MAASLMHENVVWVHNDSSDAARLYALDLETCDTVSELRLRGVQARDFEALASTRNARGRAALWVGDIGDTVTRGLSSRSIECGSRRRWARGRVG